ncbi:MAG: hypothetical protein ACREJ4_01355 [Candidatus Methylomirabilaceae bacterium]
MFTRRTAIVPAVAMLSLLACNENSGEPTRSLTSAPTLLASATTRTSKISAPTLTGEAFFTGPGGTFQFKTTPTGSMDATLQRTGDFTGRLNGTEIRFRTGLEPGHEHDFVARFPSSSLIRTEFFFGVFYQGVLDGVIQDITTGGGGTERAIGNINIGRFGTFQFVSLSLSFAFAAEGGICQVFLFGAVVGDVP